MAVKTMSARRRDPVSKTAKGNTLREFRSPDRVRIEMLYLVKHALFH
jgi:hypothetical protein